MGELLPSQPRPTGPRVNRRLGRSDKTQYCIDGIAEYSPPFDTRKEAETWLKKHLSKVPPAKRQQPRRCMCCRDEFQSEGFHHRMCNGCRNGAGGTDTGAYRVIRPSKRG